jgi:phospholipid transport system substrate-binding protein
MVRTSEAEMKAARGSKKGVAVAIAAATFVCVCLAGGQSVALAAAPAEMSSAQALGVQEQLSRVAKEMIELSDKDPELQKGNVAKARELVDKKVLPLLDKEELAKRASGRAWRDASPEQRSKLTALVPQLLGKTYARALFDLKGAKVEFSPARVIDGVAKVAAKITPKSGQPVQLAFAATLGKDGQAQVQDIVIEGVSLMGAFASNFASVVAKKGLDGLLSDLEAKVGR